MASLYVSREPHGAVCPHLPGPVCVLKGSHSILQEDNFVTEWQAIENARTLAFELGEYDGIHFKPPQLAGF